MAMKKTFDSGWKKTGDNEWTQKTEYRSETANPPFLIKLPKGFSIDHLALLDKEKKGDSKAEDRRKRIAYLQSIFQLTEGERLELTFLLEKEWL